MPAPELDLRERITTVVWWDVLGRDRYNEPVLAEPVEITVRWQDKVREVLGPQGTPVTTEADLVLGPDDVRPGDLIWKGRLQDLPGTGFRPSDGVMQVITFNASDDLKGRFTRKVATVSRYKSTLTDPNS